MFEMSMRSEYGEIDTCSTCDVEIAKDMLIGWIEVMELSISDKTRKQVIIEVKMT